MVPIWKDYIITYPEAADYVDFSIYHDEAIIYSGRAYARPGESAPRIRINDICADYIARNFPLEATDKYYFSFRVTYGGYAALVDFYRDWSYDMDFSPNSQDPAAPVLPLLHPLQFFPMYADDGIYDFTLVFRNDNGDFSLDFNGDFSVQYEDAGPTQEVTNDGHFYFLNLSAFSNLVEVRYHGEAYRVADLCGGYVLYYLNEYGGWDWLPVQGRAVRTDGLTRYNQERTYDNRTTPARGRDNYVAEVAPRMRLTIGPLTTEQSSRMHHLLTSTFVYLHDIEKGRIHPVTLTNQSAEYKSQRGTLHTYEVEVALAQTRIHR